MAEKGDFYNPMDNRLEEPTGFKEFVYNKRTGQVCGRTCTSWCKITVFYIILYACLTAFWTVMLIIFYQTLDLKHPKWKLDESRIGTVPGIGFRPRPPDDTIDSTLIYFKHGGNTNDYAYWTKDLNDFLKPYEATRENKKIEYLDCEKKGQVLPEDRVCLFNVGTAHQCTNGTHFGYEEGFPCVVIKLNRIYGWEPVPYTQEQLHDKNMKIPEEVISHYDNSSIYVTCAGENAADRENMGLVDYYPSQKIPAHFFPFINQLGYQSPFVFVRFKEVKKGVLVNIECKAWASNIQQDRMERRGSVHMEILVD